MATTIEYGKCAECGDNNPKKFEDCRRCKAPLPWSKKKMVKAVKVKAAVSPPPSVSFGRAASSDNAANMAIGAISFFVPPIGLLLYWSYSNSGDDKAGVVGLAALVGFVLHLLRFFSVSLSAVHKMH